ncbi:hypothetical protein Dimus_007794 [Dionaea muscipula]
MLTGHSRRRTTYAKPLPARGGDPCTSIARAKPLRCSPEVPANHLRSSPARVERRRLAMHDSSTVRMPGARARHARLCGSHALLLVAGRRSVLAEEAVAARCSLFHGGRELMPAAQGEDCWPLPAATEDGCSPETGCSPEGGLIPLLAHPLLASLPWQPLLPFMLLVAATGGSWCSLHGSCPPSCRFELLLARVSLASKLLATPHDAHLILSCSLKAPGPHADGLLAN